MTRTQTIIVNKEEARYLAKKFRPFIWQEHKEIRDSLTPIVLARWVDIQPLMPILIKQPTLYYLIREDKNWYYAFYMTFHVADFSTHKWSWIRKLDSHAFDTESLLFRIYKKDFKRKDIATVYHEEILMQKNASILVFIESGTHAIIPYGHKKCSKYVVPRLAVGPAYPNYKMYFKYALENLDNFTIKQWKQIRRALNGVNTPFEQKDAIWYRHNFGTQHKKGDMFLRPDLIFRKAEETKRI